MNKNEIIQAVKNAAEKYCIEEYELYYSEGEDIGCSTYRDEIDSFSYGNNISLFFRCIKDGKLGYATTKKCTEEEIELLAKRALENAAVSEKPERAIIYRGGGEYKKVENPCPDLPDVEKLKKAALECRDILYAADENIADGTSCGVYGSKSYSLLYNSKGLALEAKSGCYSVSMYAVVKNGDEEPETAYDSEFVDPDGFDKKAMADKIIEEAKSKFGAGKVKTGQYNIVFDRDCAGQILSTFHSSFFADKVQKGFSKLSRDMVGSVIASENVSIYDDPFYEKTIFKSAFDGEGYPTSTKAVIEKGVLKNLLYNLTSAEKDGVESTGNAMRSGAGIGTRAFTFYIEPGKLTDEELIKEAENGILVTGMKGFHAGANTVSGDFSIESEGFLIENGVKTRPVRSFTVSGNFFDMLKNISAVSCETEKAYLSSAVFSPAILIKDMPVAGE